jgi:hypothetical protein
MRRPVRTLLAALVLAVAAAAAAVPLFAQDDEHALFQDFNWFDIMKADPATAFNALWDHAAKYSTVTYDRKAILALLLADYGKAKDLEALFPYDSTVDGKVGYTLTYDRAYSERLALPWTNLMKLTVRSAMQYVLLECLYTKAVPKSKGKVPSTWTLFDEYFGYYAVMKKAARPAG